MSKEEDNAVFQDATNEDVRLENLGYEQGEFNGKIWPSIETDIAPRAQTVLWPT